MILELTPDMARAALAHDLDARLSARRMVRLADRSWRRDAALRGVATREGRA